MTQPDPAAAHPPPGTPTAVDPRDLPGGPLRADEVYELIAKEID